MNTIMAKNNTWYGLNLLPIYVEIVESQLEAAHAQLEKLQAAESQIEGIDPRTLMRLNKLYSSQKMDNWVFFDQCKQWRNSNPNREQLRLIAYVEKNAAQLDLISRQILVLIESLQQKRRQEMADTGFDWLLKTFSGKSR